MTQPPRSTPITYTSRSCATPQSLYGMTALISLPSDVSMSSLKGRLRRSWSRTHPSSSSPQQKILRAPAGICHPTYSPCLDLLSLPHSFTSLPLSLTQAASSPQQKVLRAPVGIPQVAHTKGQHQPTALGGPDYVIHARDLTGVITVKVLGHAEVEEPRAKHRDAQRLHMQLQGSGDRAAAEGFLREVYMVKQNPVTLSSCQDSVAEHRCLATPVAEHLNRKPGSAMHYRRRHCQQAPPTKLAKRGTRLTVRHTSIETFYES